ncbi:MAG TPA: hypothetical protein VFE57_13825 [Cyclobacteriaceae bacterium]|jgi:hypothetical protein|nr:hypothetical protein [Cyclobacteriaceae bacterium]
MRNEAGSLTAQPMNMKAAQFRFSSVAITFCFLILFSCGKNDPKPSEVERVTELLQGNAWTIKNVKVDDVVLDMYANLKVTFTREGTYTSVNGGVIWPASGTWKFKDENATAMIRQDDLEIGIQSIDASSLTVTFTWKDDVYVEGRTSAVSGKHVMTLSR